MPRRHTKSANTATRPNKAISDYVEPHEEYLPRCIHLDPDVHVHSKAAGVSRVLISDQKRRHRMLQAAIDE